MRRYLVIPVTALFLSSCASLFTHPVYGGRNVANNPNGIAAGASASGTAQPEVSDICDVESLESQRDYYRSSTASLRERATGDASAASEGEGDSAAASGGAAASASGADSSESAVAGTTSRTTRNATNTRIISRINRFDAEIDGKYRAVTSSCRAFSRCMQNNFYDEGQCRSTLARWERADQDYSDLARELREIEAEVERTRLITSRRHKGHKAYHLNQRDRCDCSSSIGGVFANCCDRDEGRRY